VFEQLMQVNLASSTVLSPWIVIPMAVITMLIVAAAITSTARHTTPASRRRIRLANGWVMLLIVPLAASGFGLIDSSTQPRLFVKSWILVIGLLCISVALAVLDMINTARLARLASRRLRLSIHTPATPTSTNADSLRLVDDDHAGGN
jgi:hypothetical protein